MKKWLLLLALAAGSVNAATHDVTQAPYNAFGNGTSNDGPAVQAAIDAALPGDIIYFPPGNTYLIPGYPGMKVKSGLTISAYGATLSQGVSFGGSGAFGRNRMFENVIDATNVKFIGGTYLGSRQAVGGMQWSIGIRLDRCVNCLLEDLVLDSWYTDGVYIGGNPPGCLGVTMRNVRITNSKRNAMSIAAAVGIRIHNSIFENTNCTSDAPNGVCTAFELNMPRTGIDFEPNNVLDVISDVVVMDSLFQNNEKSGIFTQGKGLGDTYVFHNNRFLNNADIGLIVNQVSDVTITNNYVDGARIGISLGNGVRNVAMLSNEVKNTTGNGINVAGVWNPFFAFNKVNGEKVAYIGVPLMDAVAGTINILPFE